MGDESKVIVVDVKMPFGSMVAFMVKWALAAIPAAILLYIFILLVGALVGGFFGALL